MTQQLKFGDIVLHKETGQEGSVIDFKFGVVVALHGDTHIDTFDYNEIELIPHPDTVRLDWLIKRNFDFQKCYDMGGRWWYEDNSFDEIEGTEGMTEREAIDKVMEKETEK